MSEGVVVERVTNIELADLLGVSHVHIHRIRNDSRLPSVPLMVRIEEKLDWKISDQVRARTAGKYPQEFEAAVEQYALGRNTAAGPGEESTTAPQG